MWMSKQPVVFSPLAKTYRGRMSVWIATSLGLTCHPLCLNSWKTCYNFSIIRRLPIGVRLVIQRKLFTCWRCDLMRCKRPSLSGSTSSCMLCLILGGRSIILAFFAVNSAMATRKNLQGTWWLWICQKSNCAASKVFQFREEDERR